jgi:hypothetical protein
MTGIARSTIGRGLKELDSDPLPINVIRRKGAGRRRLCDKDPGLLDEIRDIIEPSTVGDPMRTLKWVSKSHVKIADALAARGRKISPSTVGRTLPVVGYRRQVNRKSYEGGKKNPDRNAQFEHINEQITVATQTGCPIVSVDTKKKEPVGNFRNAGSDYRPTGTPDKVLDHDFPDKVLGKVAPYGVYDIANNSAWVSVGINHDTAEFAVNSLRRWWYEMGKLLYPTAKQIMITADCGGSNGYRVRLWKCELQKLANELQMDITVSHYPPGSSKWNKIEHRLFCFITQNWRGRPLLTRAAIVELICATTTKKGLIVQSAIDHNFYKKGIRVSKKQMDSINIAYDTVLPQWNYTISPVSK